MLISVKAKSGCLVPVITINVTTEEELLNMSSILFILAVLRAILPSHGELLVSCAKEPKSAVLPPLLTETKTKLHGKVFCPWQVRIPLVCVLGATFWRLKALVVLLDSPGLARWSHDDNIAAIIVLWYPLSLDIALDMFPSLSCFPFLELFLSIVVFSPA